MRYIYQLTVGSDDPMTLCFVRLDISYELISREWLVLLVNPEN